MKKTIKIIPNEYLFTIWTLILTIGLVLALFGLQENSDKDSDNLRKADVAQALAFCHAVSDNNQAIRDILSLLSVDSKTTPDMTASQIESIRVANERRAGYRLISVDLFPIPECSDGYKAKSREVSLLPMLQSSAGTTVTTIRGG